MNDDLNLTGLMDKFPDEQSCIDFVEKSRWPDGVKSPFTARSAYRITTRPGLYKCKATGQNFSVRYGTIFEDSRLPLCKWFLAIFLLHSVKDGISSVKVAKNLGVTQKTAWFMMQKIRYAFEHESFKARVSGVEGIDETYIGGHGPGKRGRGATRKIPVRPVSRPCLSAALIGSHSKN